MCVHLLTPPDSMLVGPLPVLAPFPPSALPSRQNHTYIHTVLIRIPRNTPKTCQAVEPTVKAILTGPGAVLDRIRMHRLMHTLIRMVPVSVIQEICQKISQRNVWRHRWGIVGAWR